MLQHTATVHVSCTVAESSSKVDKAETQESSEQVWFVLEDGTKILVLVNTIYF